MYFFITTLMHTHVHGYTQTRMHTNEIISHVNVCRDVDNTVWVHSPPPPPPSNIYYYNLRASYLPVITMLTMLRGRYIILPVTVYAVHTWTPHNHGPVVCGEGFIGARTRNQRRAPPIKINPDKSRYRAYL